MIAKTYQNHLIHRTLQLDKLLNNKENSLSKIINEAIQTQNDELYLEFLQEINGLDKKINSEKVEDVQQQLYESLFTYLGASRIDEIINKQKNIDSISVEEGIGQLNALIGLQSVKNQVNDLIDFNKVQQLRRINSLKGLNKTMHMAFLGNPGTGKTTVARIIGHMYKSMGLLSCGHFIEASRTELIAEYQGQTAIKVKRLIERAKGGVLFIDEAYSITENNHSDSYGRECLTELTKALEDYRDDLVVIVAGYSDLMEMFFNSNPGLKSRFNTFITFEDYTLEELIQIFEVNCLSNDYLITPDVKAKLTDLLTEKIKSEGKNFSNGRLVRNFFDDVALNQAKRVARLTDPDKQALMLITVNDLDNLT